MEKRIPEEGEYIIVRIKEISPNSAIVSMEEYADVSGFVHLSEIANCWIKDIKKFIKPNQVKVARVLRVDRHRSYINLSFKQVPVNVSRDREKEYKMEQKSNNLLKMFVAKNKSAKSFEDIRKMLLDKFYSIKEAFEYLGEEGYEKFSKEFKLDKKFTEDLYELVKKSIVKKEVSICANISVKSYDCDGLNKIKEMLDVEEEKVNVDYVSAPNYRLKITGVDYQECEKKYKEINRKIMAFSDSKKNMIDIERIKR
ncbi:MAG: S1 RNA-binding domain-containing protein [Candidatus Aenigmarchaeota archaeon]|nr:S1 RNA-binding domain-containing protein [Candidatus Aenigmarchaeota archaeon]